MSKNENCSIWFMNDKMYYILITFGIYLSPTIFLSLTAASWLQVLVRQNMYAPGLALLFGKIRQISQTVSNISNMRTLIFSHTALRMINVQSEDCMGHHNIDFAINHNAPSHNRWSAFDVQEHPATSLVRSLLMAAAQHNRICEIWLRVFTDLCSPFISTSIDKYRYKSEEHIWIYSSQDSYLRVHYIQPQIWMH